MILSADLTSFGAEEIAVVYAKRFVAPLARDKILQLVNANVFLVLDIAMDMPTGILKHVLANAGLVFNALMVISIPIQMFAIAKGVLIILVILIRFNRFNRFNPEPEREILLSSLVNYLFLQEIDLYQFNLLILNRFITLSLRKHLEIFSSIDDLLKLYI